ncbi:isochorismatase family protein [Pseudothermotoga thermarum]|uniref:Isochorismatase hydrolase n=1 Tax=Pseudothermotoga thermarum DSM 5069 TaxID=688269 RepID=F7YUU1_9THEM|nr:isochorismatase family protein [Pseudothermotoga thermarum]AEH51501.1 isochorismatase hydrolase [Pseudothermotoga thermarum DSM 5069]
MFFFEETKKHKLNLSKPALLIIDMQNYFCDKSSPAYLSGVENVIPKMETLSRKFFQLGYLVIATIHVGASRMMKEWWGNEIGQEFARFSLNVEPTKILFKNTYDAFYGTDLEEILLSNKVEQVVLTGVMTHLCVETTARSAFVKGFEVVVVEDATWDKNDWYHFASLKNLAHGFAVICKADDVICTLES